MDVLMKLDGICKVYDKGEDEIVVLDDIDLEIREKSSWPSSAHPAAGSLR